MEKDIVELIDVYKTKLERKERLVQPYIQKKNEDIHSMNEKEYADYKVYEASINLLKIIIKDLEIILEDNK